MKKTLSLLSILMILFFSSASGQMLKNTGIGKTVEITSKSLLEIEPNVLEDFESYTDFSINFSPWTLTDVDQLPTYGFSETDFTNEYVAMSFIIFNPASTTPPFTTEAIQPHSGNKFAACFAAQPSGSQYNDDWMISPQMQMGTSSHLSFWARSYTTDYGNEKLKVLVSTTGTNTSDFVEIQGSSAILLPDSWTKYDLNIETYNNQQIYIAFQCVSQDAFVLMIDDILVSTEQGSGDETSLTGVVTDAFNGNPISGATVSIGGLSATTNAQGQYTINSVPEGSVTANFMGTPTNGEAPLSVQFSDLSTVGTQLVTANASGYIEYQNSQVIIVPGQENILQISLSPELSGDGLRFVVNWGAQPRDLDSHLRTPEIEGQTYHVYYPSTSQGSATSAPYATLDHDVTQGYGPETITIHQFFNGTYHYYIYKYAGDGEITVSAAVIQIYNESGLLYTLQVPTSGTGRYWYVATVDGATSNLNIVNTIQESEPGTGKLNVDYPKKEDNNKAGRKSEIISWNWDFGDGQSSTEKNPTHVYQNGGVYNISLTAGDGTNQHTFTRENYIQVEGTQGTSTLSGQVTNALNGDPIEGALVEVAGLSDYTNAQGNYSISNVPEGSLTSNFTATPTQGVSPLIVQFTNLYTNNTQLVTCSASGFSTYNNNQVVISAGSTVTLNISLSQQITGDEMRFVLNWGANPRDLDSHLRTPEIEGSAYHVYYPSANQGSATSAPWATLDHDVTQGYGPETITIYQFFNGDYHYYIYKYAGDGEIINSEAVVQIYNQSGLISTLQAPTSGTGRYWYIGTINGATQTFNLINVIQETEPGVIVQNKEPQKPKNTVESFLDRKFVSYNWNFGDGVTSDHMSPLHTYQANGAYTVTLTVGDGTASSTEVKENYINVGAIYAVNEFDLESVTFYPNPVIGHVSFDSQYPMNLVKIYDQSGRLLIEQTITGKSHTLDLKEYNAGMYIVQIYCSKGIITKKLEIQ